MRGVCNYVYLPQGEVRRREGLLPPRLLLLVTISVTNVRTKCTISNIILFRHKHLACKKRRRILKDNLYQLFM